MRCQWRNKFFQKHLQSIHFLAFSRPTLGHSKGESLTNLMLITAFFQLQPEGYREPRNEVASLSLADHLVGCEPGTFRF